MRGITRLGVRAIIVGALIGCLLGAGTASAAAPELGRCVKVTPVKEGGKVVYHGGFTNGTCTTASEAKLGKYEWEPGPGPDPFFSIVSKGTMGFTFKLATNAEGKCTGVSGSGDYTGPKTVGGVHITFSGCSFSGAPCQEIKVGPLNGELGVYALGETALKNKLGIKFTPESGTTFAEFECQVGTSAVNPFVWRGGFVIGEITANTLPVMTTLAFHQHKTPGAYGEEDIPANFIGESPSPLESSTFTLSGHEGEFEKLFAPMGWNLGVGLLPNEKMEASSVD